MSKHHEQAAWTSSMIKQHEQAKHEICMLLSIHAYPRCGTWRIVTCDIDTERGMSDDWVFLCSFVLDALDM